MQRQGAAPAEWGVQTRAVGKGRWVSEGHLPVLVQGGPQGHGALGISLATAK